jgi:hypothetical protein
METHRQLGLPPCTFYWVTGLPCPSCGMTTSFSHLAHGSISDSLRANPAGTLLAVGALTAIPWCLASAVWGRRFGVHDYELLIARGMLVLFGILLVSWVLRLGWIWACGELGKGPPAPAAGDVSNQESGIGNPKSGNGQGGRTETVRERFPA